MEYSEEVGIILGFFSVWRALTLKPDSTGVCCAITAPLGRHSMSSQLSGTIHNVSIQPPSMALQSLLNGGVFMTGFWSGVPGRSLYLNIIED